MKLKYKKWIFLVFLSTCLLYMSALLLFNVIIDIDHIFHSKETNQGRISGDIRYGKIEYLEKHFQEYNSYIIGGSRSGIIQGKCIEPYIKGSKFYNLSMTFNKIGDSYLLIKYIIDHYNVKNILLQISGTDFQPTTSSILRDHFKISGKNSLLYYLSHFLTLDIQHTIQLLNAQRNPSNYYFKPSNFDGSWDHNEIEEYISKNSSNYFKNHIKKPKDKGFIKDLYSDSTLALLKSIKKYCEQHEVNLFTYFVPDNHSYLDQFDTNSLDSLLRKISIITDFWFFSGYNSITTNDTNYYDIVHYRLFIADLIMKKMFSDTVLETVDFGTFITKTNINKSLDLLNKKITLRNQK